MTGGRRKWGGWQGGGWSAEKLNFNLASVGKGRAVQERGGRWPARTSLREKTEGKQKDSKRQGEGGKEKRAEEDSHKVRKGTEDKTKTEQRKRR